MADDVTFRERALLALVVEEGATPKSAVEIAQEIADAACEAWGHGADWNAGVTCERCGRRRDFYEPNPPTSA
jgi:hypothetical protein